MADHTGNYHRVINFWKLNLQKMGLELKCSLCLNMLDGPTLLPCDHLLCRSCIPNVTESGSDCPICCHHYVEKDLRRTPHMENILSIYKSMDAALSTIAFQSATQSCATVDGPVTEDQNQGKNLDPMAQTQPPPCTPPSFGGPNDSENDHSDHSDEHSIKRVPTKCTVSIKTEVGKCSNVHGRPNTWSDEEHVRETKRQKLEFGSQNMISSGGIHIHSSKLGANCSLKSKSEIGCKLDEQLPTSENLHASPNFVCAFCQSSKISEVHGPMLHYLKGKAVELEKLTHPGVLHVHRRCVEWTPQVFYLGEGENETVENLELEIARAAKLKCSKCQMKGASLGCLLKSCRKSFHVPCAVYIDECRWDVENFLMYCPAHSSHKFPSERSVSKKKNGETHLLTTEIASQQPEEAWEASPSATKEWIICGSALESPEKSLLLKFAKETGVTVSKAWDKNVTHVIASTDENGAYCRTLKVLMAILNGKWILNIDWIKACMEAMNIVDEEPYEVNIDVYGCQDGPKKGRLKVLEKAPKLFNGLQFCFCGHFDPSYKGYLEELVEAGGGSILTADTLISQRCKAEIESSTSLVVFNLDLQQESGPDEKALVRKQRQEEAKKLAFQTQSWVVDHTWILESIASVELQPYSC